MKKFVVGLVGFFDNNLKLTMVEAETEAEAISIVLFADFDDFPEDGEFMENVAAYIDVPDTGYVTVERLQTFAFDMDFVVSALDISEA